MGNRGMTNWKLGAFFVIGLMLVCGGCSVTPRWQQQMTAKESVAVAWDASAFGDPEPGEVATEFVDS